MAALICKTGDPVKWHSMHQLMADIMEGSAGEYSEGKESTPEFNKTLDETSPFYLDSVYEAAPALHMSLNGGVVTEAYLVQTPGDTSPWDLPEPLNTLADQGRLYFVAEEDGCFCKTIWKVNKSSGASTLVQVSAAAKMACQSIDVPAEGTPMPCAFVPNVARNRMLRRASGGSRSEQTWTENKCSGVDGLLYSTVNDRVQWVQRSMTGYFTWTIAKADYDRIIEAMYNVFIEWPCGFEKSKWWHDYDTNYTPGAGQKREEDEAGPLGYDDWMSVWAWTAKLLAGSDGWAFASKPGCLELALTPYVGVKYPWDVPTCGDKKTCPDQKDKLLVRCATLQVLEALVKRLKQTVVRTKCVAELKYYNSFQQGFAQACSIGANPDGNGYYTTTTATNSCSKDGIHYQNCSIISRAEGGVRTWGGDNPEPSNDCTVEVEDGCEDLPTCDPDPDKFDYSTGGGSTSSSVLAAAKGAAGAAGWVDGVPTAVTMSVGNGSVNGNPFYGGSPVIVATSPFYSSAYGSGASYIKERLKLTASNLAKGHVFKIVVKRQKTVYDDYGDPTTETQSTATHTIGPGETYTETCPDEQGVFLTAEIWHDKAPT